MPAVACAVSVHVPAATNWTTLAPDTVHAAVDDVTNGDPSPAYVYVAVNPPPTLGLFGRLLMLIGVDACATANDCGSPSTAGAPPLPVACAVSVQVPTPTNFTTPLVTVQTPDVLDVVEVLPLPAYSYVGVKLPP
jgi:hypothetical protein